MQNRAKNLLTYIALIIVSVYYLFFGLVKAQAFLAPLAIGLLLAMIILPVASWLEKKGFNRILSSLVSTITVLLFFLVLAGVVALQVNRFVKDWSQIKERMQPKIERLQQYVSNETGMTIIEQKQKIDEYIPGRSRAKGADSTAPAQKPEGQTNQENIKGNETTEQQNGGESKFTGSMFSKAGTFLAALASFLGSFVLIFTYIFFLLMYRSRFKEALVKFAPYPKREQASDIIRKSAKISQQYLFGVLILVFIQSIIIYIGLAITGVNNAILISILAAFLTLIPFVGNIFGYVLALSMGLFSTSATSAVIGVSITFAVAQLLENNVLQPYIVGQKVNLNPFITIIIVILGGSVWGISGMLIAIPALGILKVICDNIPLLHPVGYLIGGEEKKDGDKNKFGAKVKKWVKDKFQKP